MRVAMKITDEALAMIGELTGTDEDVFGDSNYALFTIISIAPFELNAKFLTEEQILSEVQNDNDIQIIGL